MDRKGDKGLCLWSYLELTDSDLNAEFRRNLFSGSLYWRKGFEIFHQEITFWRKLFFKMKNDEYAFLIFCSIFHLQAATLSCCPDVGWWALSESCGTEKSGVFLILKSKEIHNSAPLFYGTVLILGLVCSGLFCLVCWWFIVGGFFGVLKIF